MGFPWSLRILFLCLCFTTAYAFSLRNVWHRITGGNIGSDIGKNIPREITLHFKELELLANALTESSATLGEKGSFMAVQLRTAVGVASDSLDTASGRFETLGYRALLSLDKLVDVIQQSVHMFPQLTELLAEHERNVLRSLDTIARAIVHSSDSLSRGVLGASENFFWGCVVMSVAAIIISTMWITRGGFVDLRTLCLCGAALVVVVVLAQLGSAYEAALVQASAEVKASAAATERMHHQMLTTFAMLNHTAENCTCATNDASHESAVPTGSIIHVAHSTPPAGFVSCDGAALDRTAYPALFDAIGTSYGGNGTPFFHVPDLRGEFIRGWDVRGDRPIGNRQSWAMEIIRGEATSLSETWGNFGKATGAFVHQGGHEAPLTPVHNDVGSCGKLYFDSSRVVKTASETRPQNVVLLACIKF